MITDPEHLIGRRIAFRQMHGVGYGRVVSAGIYGDTVKVQQDKTKQSGTVSISDIIKVYDPPEKR